MNSQEKFANPNALSAAHLLAIGKDQPERAFSFDVDEARKQWRALSSHWHPDRNTDPQARWVFSHVQDLYQAARDKRDGGVWDLDGELRLFTTTGRSYCLRYANRHALDVGKVYVGRHVLAYAIERQYDDLARHAVRMTAELPFADERMEKAMAPYLPQPIERLETQAAHIHVLRKPQDYVALRDLLDQAGGSLESRHVAWIVSALCNLCCYLETSGLAHQAIDIDHCLVSPENHAIGLVGGWWYASTQYAPMHALPARSARLAPPDVLRRKLADVRLDQFLLRATAVELLGDEFDRTPAPMRDFFDTAAATDRDRRLRTLAPRHLGKLR